MTIASSPHRRWRTRDASRVKITLADIAYDLGVSTATVSLALRDSPLVAQETAARVRERAQAMGYVYNRRAASLRTKRSDIVGVIVRDIINPFFAEILASIEAEVGANKQTFLLCNHNDDKELQDSFVETLIEFGADGVILSPSVGTTPDDIARMERSGLPVVTVARTVEDAGVPAFIGNDREGLALATAHLIERGHTDIALIGGTRKTSTGRDRRQGFADACDAAGLDPKPRIDIEIPYSRRRGFEVAEEMVREGQLPTAIACCSDTIALGVMSALQRHGVRVGDDVAVTGYDDIEEAAFAPKALTTVYDGHHEMGRLAARALYEKITGGEVETRPTTVAPKLVVRASSGADA